jgi:hypothetical protein
MAILKSLGDCAIADEVAGAQGVEIEINRQEIHL